jgi:hypothetical protein
MLFGTCQSYSFLLNVVELNVGENVAKMSEEIYIVERFPIYSEKAVILFVRNYQERLQLNWTHQLFAYADDVNIVAENIDIIK